MQDGAWFVRILNFCKGQVWVGLDGLDVVRSPAMAPKSSRKGKAVQKLPFSDEAIQPDSQLAEPQLVLARAAGPSTNDV